MLLREIPSIKILVRFPFRETVKMKVIIHLHSRCLLQVDETALTKVQQLAGLLGRHRKVQNAHQQSAQNMKAFEIKKKRFKHSPRSSGAKPSIRSKRRPEMQAPWFPQLPPL